MKRAIGAIAVYKNKQNDRTALLQVRSTDDSFPGCVEKTWGGGAKKAEKLASALRREFREESADLFTRADSSLPSTLKSLSQSNENVAPQLFEQPYVFSLLGTLREKGKKLIVTLLCEINDHNLIRSAQPLLDAGLIVAITAQDIHRLIPIDAANKHAGISNNDRSAGKLGMFPDEIQAVKKALSSENI